MAGLEINGMIFPDYYGSYPVYPHKGLRDNRTLHESKRFLVRVRQNRREIVISAAIGRDDVFYQKIIDMPIYTLNQAHNLRATTEFTHQLNSAFRAGKRELDRGTDLKKHT